MLPAYLYLGVVGVALASIDLDVHRLPDVLVLPVGAGGPGSCWRWRRPRLGQWGRSGGPSLAALVLFAGYFLLMILSPAGRRARLRRRQARARARPAAGLGRLGSGGGRRWQAAFVLGGLVSVVLLALRRVSRQSSIAFGPAMIAGAFVALVFPVQVLTGAS